MQCKCTWKGIGKRAGIILAVSAVSVSAIYFGGMRIRQAVTTMTAPKKETLNKARLTALHAICLQIFRHIAQKSLAIRQYACGISMQSAEKSDYASYAQALFSVS